MMGASIMMPLHLGCGNTEIYFAWENIWYGIRSIKGRNTEPDSEGSIAKGTLALNVINVV